MGWFSKKDKKEEEKEELKFPPLKSEFPKYESDLHHEAEPSQDLLGDDMPPLKRPPQKKITPYKPLPTHSEVEHPPIKQKIQETRMPNTSQIKPREMPPPKPIQGMGMESFDKPMYSHKATPVQVEKPIKQGKTIFVKVEQYEDALEKIDKIMEKVSAAEDTIHKINQLRTQEAKELEEWESELSTIKSKLKAVDKSLFGR